MGDLLSNETTILESAFFMREDEPSNHVLILPKIPFVKSLFVYSLTTDNHVAFFIFSACNYATHIFSKMKVVLES